jgi:hypothetical protein
MSVVKYVTRGASLANQKHQTKLTFYIETNFNKATIDHHSDFWSGSSYDNLLAVWYWSYVHSVQPLWKSRWSLRKVFTFGRSGVLLVNFWRLKTHHKLVGGQWSGVHASLMIWLKSVHPHGDIETGDDFHHVKAPANHLSRRFVSLEDTTLKLVHCCTWSSRYVTKFPRDGVGLV